jgi:hypothetical protein
MFLKRLTIALVVIILSILNIHGLDNSRYVILYDISGSMPKCDQWNFEAKFAEQFLRVLQNAGNVHDTIYLFGESYKTKPIDRPDICNRENPILLNFIVRDEKYTHLKDAIDNIAKDPDILKNSNIIILTDGRLMPQDCKSGNCENFPDIILKDPFTKPWKSCSVVQFFPIIDSVGKKKSYLEKNKDRYFIDTVFNYNTFSDTNYNRLLGSQIISSIVLLCDKDTNINKTAHDLISRSQVLTDTINSDRSEASAGINKGIIYDNEKQNSEELLKLFETKVLSFEAIAARSEKKISDAYDNLVETNLKNSQDSIFKHIPDTNDYLVKMPDSVQRVIKNYASNAKPDTNRREPVVAVTKQQEILDIEHITSEIITKRIRAKLFTSFAALLLDSNKSDINFIKYFPNTTEYLRFDEYRINVNTLKTYLIQDITHLHIRLIVANYFDNNKQSSNDHIINLRLKHRNRLQNSYKEDSCKINEIEKNISKLKNEIETLKSQKGLKKSIRNCYLNSEKSLNESEVESLKVEKSLQIKELKKIQGYLKYTIVNENNATILLSLFETLWNVENEGIQNGLTTPFNAALLKNDNFRTLHFKMLQEIKNYEISKLNKSVLYKLIKIQQDSIFKVKVFDSCNANNDSVSINFYINNVLLPLDTLMNFNLDTNGKFPFVPLGIKLFQIYNSLYNLDGSTVCKKNIDNTYPVEKVIRLLRFSEEIASKRYKQALVESVPLFVDMLPIYKSDSAENYSVKTFYNAISIIGGIAEAKTDEEVITAITDVPPLPPHKDRKKAHSVALSVLPSISIGRTCDDIDYRHNYNNFLTGSIPIGVEYFLNKEKNSIFSLYGQILDFGNLKNIDFSRTLAPGFFILANIPPLFFVGVGFDAPINVSADDHDYANIRFVSKFGLNIDILGVMVRKK